MDSPGTRCNDSPPPAAPPPDPAPAGVEFAVPVPERFIAIARPGDVVFLESPVNFSPQVYEAIRMRIANALEGSGVRAVLLSAGIKVARLGFDEG